MSWDKEGQSGLANVTKQRDSRTEGKFAFTLDDVDVDLRDDGSLVTSCVVVPVDDSLVTTASKAPRLTKAARAALRALQQALDEHGVVPPPSDHIPAGVRVVTEDQWRECAYRIGISTSQEDRAKQQAFQRAMERLIDDGHVGVWDGHAWTI